MKFVKTLAVALAVAAAGSAAFAQDRTIIRETPNGTVVKHIEHYGDRGDLRAERMMERRHEDWRAMHGVRHDEMRRVKVVRRVTWTDHHGNRHVRRIVEWRNVPMHSSYAMR